MDDGWEERPARPTSAEAREASILRELASQLAWPWVGHAVEGPGRSAVRVALSDPCRSSSPSHVSLDFLLDRMDPDAPVLNDCAVGHAGTHAGRISTAVQQWRAIALPTLLELQVGDSSVADHYLPPDADAMPGWHCIHGPWVAWGTSASFARSLQAWAVAHPVLPVLGPSIAPRLDPTRPNAVRVLFGTSRKGPLAEVKVDGVRVPAAAEALLGRGFPRGELDTNLCRAFIVALHPMAP